VWALVLAALLPALLAGPANAQSERLAILPIIGEGVLLDDLAPIEDQMRKAVEKRGAWNVLSRHHTTRELASARELGLHCGETALGCLVRFGLVAEIDLLIVPRVSESGRFLVVGASLIDVREEREVARLVRVFDRRAAADRVATLTLDLLTTDPDTGAVVLTVEPSGAVVELDGEVQGNSPLRGPITALSRGPHELIVRKDGYRSVRATIEVRARAVTGYQVRLSEARAAPVRRSAAPPLQAGSDDEGLEPALERDELGALIAGGVGGAVAFGAGLGAIAFGGIAGDPSAPEADRQDATLAVRALLVASTAGALVAVGSVTYLGMSLLE
jgi:hypothetical protein